MLSNTLFTLGVLALGVAADLTDFDTSDNRLNPLSLGLYGTPEIQHPIRLEVEGKVNPLSLTAEDGILTNHRFHIGLSNYSFRGYNNSTPLTQRRGSLYRGAAGTWDVSNYTSEHWFDGFSRNHRFEISNGKVKYRSRNATDEIIDCKLPP